ncbi:signal recognition particle receptor subunit beta-like [Centruroides sculpturatus]|uniref:signal recognition particle receptor subunit beta-like n=1 Tax=Centruroides sculpturatus TaxID=218467 RepID=UPI000C6CDC62|nr:signal recognition particle receptor subunit beta-like [Centruroides sculpturatus]
MESMRFSDNSFSSAVDDFKREWLSNLSIEEFWHDNAFFISVAIGLFVVFLTILIFVLKRRKLQQRGVLIFGLSDSGKTLLYCRLVASKRMHTFASMKENSAIIDLKSKKSLRLIDLPGNDRLRMKLLDDFKHLARGVIFVIDSLNFSREIRDVAELLYTVLSDNIINQNRVPFLILCNKQDEAMAKGSKVIQSQLEKEINTLRITRSASLDLTSEVANNNTFLGKKGKDFEFGDLKPIRVEFMESSAWSEEESSNISDIINWLAKIA